MVKATKHSGQRKHGVQCATMIVGSAIALAAAPASALAGGGQGADGVATGACCAPDEACMDVTSVACAQMGGTYLGDGSTCGGSSGCVVQVDEITVLLSPNQWSLTFDQFDGARGRLDRAIFLNNYQILVSGFVENLTELDGVSAFLLVLGYIDVEVSALSLMSEQSLELGVSSPPLAASDGVPFSGPDFHDYGMQVAEVDEIVAITDQATLGLAVGTGEIVMDAQAVAAFSFQFPVDMAATVNSFDGAHETTLVYLFDRCPADVDGDSVVGFSDLLSVLQAWGACDGCDADVDADGAVGLSDLLQVLASWGDCP